MSEGNSRVCRYQGKGSQINGRGVVKYIQAPTI
jgi:hypothetical protein